MGLNVMKVLSTKELYHNYYTGISLDLKTGKKRIISDIERKKVIIYGLDSTIVKQTILAYIEVEYYNYIIDKDGYVISGRRDKKVKERELVGDEYRGYRGCTHHDGIRPEPHHRRAHSKRWHADSELLLSHEQ